VEAKFVREPLLIRYMQPLIAGRRSECFAVIADALSSGLSAEEIVCDVVWPAAMQVERLYEDDRMNLAAHRMACRVNHTVVAQLQPRLTAQPRNGRKAVITSSESGLEELGSQILADLLEASGWEVYLTGGGIPHDEILALIGELRPEAMVIFGTNPDDVPSTRALVDLIREVGVCPNMNVVVGGGIYNRADGLWQEVGADAFAPGPRELCVLLRDLKPRQPHAPRIGVVKKRHRRRKSLGAAAAAIRAAGARVLNVARN